ncbi:hypothetical protein [Chlorogloeopsis sp. ULAP02]|uniref:hypothetical protein n=1 Tax=Chlorogloeopsis sp. ULAP02 TaxID=3107926 RepID=UPI003135A03A
MNKAGKIGALLIGGLVFSAAPAMAAFPTFSDRWLVTYWQDDTRNQTLQACLNFTNNGGSFGATIGGTFNSPTFANWTGSWVQQGDRVRWWGIYSPTNTATSYEGTLINSNLATGYYLHYPTAAGVAGGTSIGTWSAQKGGC